jgi:hypothetical protein
MLMGQTYATILRVALDGSQDYTLIQPAITQSCDGDTVLVYPGHYYENLSMMGKNITLASLELTTGNIEYKHSTIIDGNQSGSVIIIQNGESDITIRGLTISNGSGWTSANMNYGGGIQIGGLSGGRNVRLINNIICNNKADSGGGVFISTANVLLSGTSIFKNISRSGGGVRFENTISGQWSLSFDSINRSSIYNNYAALGSDLFTYNKNYTTVVVDTFTVANPWNFYACGIASNDNIINPFTFDILNTSGHQEINQDLYVAPWGSDDNSGTSPQDPFQTIFHATYMIASDSQNPKTIYLAEGVYSQSLNNQILPAPLKTNTSIIGVSEDLTIIDGDGQFASLITAFHSENISVSKISFRNSRTGLNVSYNNNASMINLKLHDLEETYVSVGISMKRSTNIEIRNVEIYNVTSHIAKGIEVDTSTQMLDINNVSIRNLFSADNMRAVNMGSMGNVNINRLSITNCNSNNYDEFAFNTILQIIPSAYAQSLKIKIANSLFADNYQAYNLKPMMFVTSLNDTTTIQNCTFAANIGGNSILGLAGTASLINNNFWNPDLAYEIDLPYLENGAITNLSLYYNNIRGGSNGVLIGAPYYTVTWGAGNLNVDPMFRMSIVHPYSLLGESPLIDYGSPNSNVLDLGYLDLGANERFWDGNGDEITRIDIGAYEFQNMPRPDNLSYQVLQNAVELNWDMPQYHRSLSGYRVYRDGLICAELGDPAQLQYVDSISSSGTYTYYITAMYGLLESAPSEEVQVFIEVTSSNDEMLANNQISLSAYPNPFNPTTTISYSVPDNGDVTITIYNAKGQLVNTLVNEYKNKGSYQVIWNGKDIKGNSVASGLYFTRLISGGETVKNKMLLMK